MLPLDTITRDRLIKIWQTVLGRTDIGVHDDFFELGGESISGAQVIARIAEELQITIPISHLFRNPTIAGLEECVESGGELAKRVLSPPGQLPRPEHLPLAYAQQRLWFMAQMEGGSRAYHMGAGFRLRGVLKVAALERALNRIVARHEPLRTTFAVVEGQPVQRIAQDGSFRLLKHDLRGQDESELMTLVEEEADAPFDLEAGPLIRGRLICTGEQQHVLLITMHHIVSDGWSMGVLVEELSALYRAYGEEEDPLPELKVQYADYATWQRKWMEGEVLQRQAEYWKNTLAGAPALLELPADYERPAEQDYAGAVVEFILEEELTAGLTELSKSHGTTMYMTLLAGWAALLGRLSGQQEVVIGTPTANRNRSEIEKLIGCFINTLAVRVNLSGEPTVAELLDRVKVQTVEGQQHQDLPFEHVVELSQPVRSLAHSPLFQVMFAWQNTPGAKLNFPGVEVEELRSARMTTKFDLTLSLRPVGGQIIGGVTYATALFERETVERYVGYLCTLLHAMVAGEAQLVERLPLLSEEEKRRVLEEFNDTAADYPRDRCVHELFEAQAEKDAQAPAVVYQEKEYSYGELNRRANQLAHYLRGLGVRAETRVAICCERSLEMMVGVLAVWKAGGAYVPLDSNHPRERLGYLLEDAGAEVVLTQESVRAALPAGHAQVISLDGEWRRIAAESEENPGNLTRPQNLAYVIYTSGSTGQPKGVMVEHGSVVNLFFALRDRVYGGVRRSGLRVAVNGPVTFDTSVKQMVQLLAGHALDIVPEEVRRDGEALLRYVRERKIEVLDCTPSQLRLLLEAGLLEEEEKQEQRSEQERGENPGLVLVGGEAIEEDLWGRLCESEIGFFNVYGPTECTVDAAVCAIGRESAAQTIGRPIANTQIYILDGNQQPQPVGVAGELHIAGDGVARGYLNRVEQTEQKFMANPFAAGGRMYRTGDRARWLADGSIQYLGRMDTQVKVRGYRIELGEIEARLNQHPGIEESVVIARGEDVHRQLIAFYRAKESAAGSEQEKQEKDGKEIGQEELRRHVLRSLPDYMVPAGFVRVEAIPLTANGKVDRRELEGREVKIAAGRQYVGPRNEREREMVGIWAEVLQLEAEKIGVEDNFFELGGHSLLATQVMAKMRSRLGMEWPLKVLFERPSVGQLAEWMAGAETESGEVVAAIVPVDRSRLERLPLSYAQERLWFLQQMEPDSAGYNVPLAVRVVGELDIAQLERAFAVIIGRHENLRTVFPSQEGQAQQVIVEAEQLDFKLEYQDLSPWPEEECGREEEHEEERERRVRELCEAAAAKPFDLARGPLLRGQVIRLAEREHVLMLTLHHIISDGWSVGVLLRELDSILKAFGRGESPQLPALPIQYADYSVWQRRRLEQDGVLERQLGYWEKKLEGVAESLDLTTDYPRPRVQEWAGATHRFTLDGELTEGLKSLGGRQGSTLYMVLLAALQTLLYRYSGQNDICVGSPIANRQYAETEGLIGMFVNTLAMRSQVAGEQSFSQLLSQVKATCLEAYENQDAPFEKVVERLQPERNLGMSPIFQVMVILQNAVSGKQGEAERFRRYRLQTGISKFDLTAVFKESEEGLTASLRYRSGLYKRETMERMAGHFTALCRAIVTTPEARIGELDYLDAQEKRRVLEEFNDTAADYPRDRCVHELFEAQAEKDAQAPAVVYQEKEYSYGELNRRANQLAHYLRGLGVRAETRVAICCERSLEMMVGVLAVWKAGGAYVPLDSNHPRERLGYLLEDAGAEVVLTQESVRAALPAGHAQVISLDGEWRRIAAESEENPGNLTRPQNLAYVIYTSGSTGQPKGVMVEHGSVVNLFFALRDRVYGGVRRSGLRVAVNGPVTFDTSVKQMVQLLAGHALDIVPEEVRRDGEALLRYVRERKIEVLDCTPSQLRLLLEAGLLEEEEKQEQRSEQERGENPGLVLVGGEAIEEDLWGRLCESEIGFFNVYGPTECTVDAAVCAIGRESAAQTIGRPIANTQIYILDGNQQPQPVGVAGELHIAGDGVARGYLNRVEQTEQKFMANPFAAGGRMYRTGDRARWLADGSIQYLGRMDTQVKVRGYRIELGEIEARLNQHPGIEESVVIARGEDVHRQLIAFYRAKESAAGSEQEKQEKDGKEIGQEELRRHVLRSLPDYMVPAGFVRVEAIPLTANGKVDRRELEGREVKIAAGRQYVGPRNEREREMVGIWAEVLQLEAEKIGVEDNFFELGGHSLLATQVMAKMRSRLGMEWPLKVLFERPSVGQLAEWMAGAETESGEVVTAIVPVDRSRLERLPLSYAQERLWFLQQMEPDSAGYNVPLAVRVVGELDIAQLERAFAVIIGRHENLRTVFPSQEGQAQQVIVEAEQLDFKLEYQDLSPWPEEERERRVRELCEAAAAKPFDLARGPLLRGQVIRLAEREHVLMLTLHHIISDGWSVGVLLRELDSILKAFGRGESPQLPALPIQYADYSVWQRRRLEQDGVLERQLGYWEKKLEGVAESLDLTTDYPRPRVQEWAGATHRFTLDGELTEGLKSLGGRQGSTLYMVLLAALQTLLYRYSGQNDICVGSPIANRQYAETEGLIGMFVNTLAMRSQVAGEQSFSQLLSQVKATCLEAYENQDAPFEKVVERLQPERNLGMSPIFQVMVILQNAVSGKQGEAERFRRYRLQTGISKFDLTAVFKESEEGLTASLRYRSGLYKRETMERMAGHFTALCRAIVTTPEARIGELDYLDAQEKRRVLEEFNDTAADYPRDRCVHELFEAQAEKDAQAPAVVYQEKEYSYGELNRRANQLAHYLRGLGVRAETRVAICCERSLEMMVGVLAVWKAGGAYVPLDSNHPRERLGYLLEDAGAEVVLTQESVRAALPAGHAQVISLDGEWRRIAAESEENPGNLTRPQNLAYVIYTSGSTGQPKGVMVEHGSVVNLFFALRDRVYGGVRRSGLRVAVNGPVTFDTSVKQMVQLLAGHALDIVPEEVRRDGEALLRYVRERKIEVLDCTPSQLRLLLEAGLLEEEEKQEQRSEQERGENPGLVLVGGEAIEEDLWGRLCESEIGFFNVYGPTECTVDAAVCAIGRESAAQTIGRPIANTQIYILDGNQQPQPVGVAGELHIAGDGVARGYLNRVEQTEQKFMANPFAAGGRMYRTGDRARWLADGSIQYLGRMDTQVKVRGYRIELGEIEARLNQHPGIEESVVIARGEDVHRQLIAFYRAKESAAGSEQEKQEKDGKEIGQEELRRHVLRSLPDYMVPAGFVRVEAIPLTANGKVDRRELEGREVKIAAGRQYVGPRNEREREMVGIWAEVLQLEAEKIGVEDNFFELGGHSLLATQVMAKMRSRLGMEWPLKVLFERPSVGQLAEWMAGAETESGEVVTAIVPVDRSRLERLPLSYAQERLWFLQQMEPDSAGYNVPLAVRVVGELDIAQLERAFAVIIGRHENLRTVFPSQEGQAQQVIVEAEQLDFKLEYQDLSPWPEEECGREEEHEEERERRVRELCEAAAAKPFDLARGPLLRGQVIRLAEREHVLMLTLHHIISDGWSVGVLLRELDSILKAFGRGESPQLPALPIQYADYSVWQRRRLEQDGVLERQLGYWEKKLEGVAESLDLTTDYPRPRVQEWAGATHRFTLDGELTEGLKSLGGRQGSTLYMVLLAALQTLLYRYSGQNDICVGSPIANRQYAETEGLIGMFVNTLAMRSQVAGEQSFSQLLSQVKATCLEAYENQDAPFEKVVERLQPERNLGMSPIFQVMVILQNAVSGKQGEAERFRRYRLQTGISKFDLTAVFKESEEGLTASLRYRSGLYKRETMERMAGHFTALCRAIVTTPEARIGELDYLDAQEKRRVLEEFNDTAADYPRDRCVHELFEAQAARQGEKTVVVCGEEQWSYGQLHEQSRALALYLQAQGVGPECVVAVCMERSAELVVGVLGILQAGGAYVPLDPAYPEERLAYMLWDSGAALVLTQESLRERLQALIPADARLIAIDGDGQWPEISACVAELKANHVQLKRQVRPHHLAYVIYTSGSTGQPKGVMVEHRNLSNLVEWHRSAFKLTEGDSSTCVAGVGFDATTWEIWPPLCVGGTLVLPPTKTLDNPEALLKWWALLPIDVSFLPTPLAEFAFARKINNSHLRTLLVGGDRLHQLPSSPHSFSLINNYGPTECTVVATSGLLNSSTEVLHIGRPIANTQIYILDGNQQPQPVGVAGELHIAGDGVARGYLNRVEQTEQKFMANPFAAGGRMYRTGDRARWLADGSIQYLGRMDTQVKVRGYRIELGEIEARLNQHPGIEESVVIARGEDVHRQLIAFYRAKESAAGSEQEKQEKDGKEIGQEELRRHVLRSLPDYMVPAGFVRVEAIPLTANGKVDRRELEGREVKIAAGRQYVGPRNEREREMVGIWAEVLQLEAEKIGVEDNFFELGGHSLLATQVMAKMRSRLGMEWPLKVLFERPSVGQLAEWMAGAETESGEVVTAIVPVDRSRLERLPLSYAQERLWFLQQMEPDSAGYNVPLAVRVVGELDIAQLERAFAVIIGRHENLRTVFPSQEGQAQQVIVEAEQLDFKLEYQDLSPWPEEERERRVRELCEAAAAKPFDLARGPLLRGQVIRLAEREHVLMLTLHHIISDGWSVGVLLRELDSILKAFGRGESPQLPALPIQYADYSVWQRRRLEQDGVLERQLGYWEKKLEGVAESLDLTTDYPRPRVQEWAGATHRFTLDGELTEGLKSLGGRQGSTLYMVLLAALQTLLYRYSGQNDICVGSPIANRQYAETEGLIGMFVNTLAMRSQVAGEQSFSQLLSQVKATCLEAYENQDAPFEKVVERLQPERNLGMSPIFQVMVILQNAVSGKQGEAERFRRYRLQTGISKFDLTAVFKESEEGLTASLRYRSGLYKRETMERMAGHFTALCRAIVTTPEARIGELDYLEEREKRRVLEEFNDTAADYPRDRCVHELFEAQAEKDAQAPAVVCGEEQWSYGQLHEQSRALALYLQAQGVGPECVVAVCMERSAELVVGVLGILQAGGAYVPLDPAYPEERLAYMLRDSGAALVLTQESLRERLQALIPADARLIAIDGDGQWPEISACVAELKANHVQLKRQVRPRHLAYVIYTSGSTGQPKGVAIEHHSSVTLVQWASAVYSREELAGVLASTSICFDLSVYEIFVTLACGGKIILVPNALGLVDLSEKERESVTLINTVPSAMEELVRLGAIPNSVRTINLAGEALSAALVDKIYDTTAVEKIYDLYGPSEDTTYSTYALRKRHELPTIGRPISNTQIYILDGNNQPQPVGVPGELHIAGDGLARGYLHRPELTDAKFVANPFAAGTRMYRTGDRARWLEDGSIQYLGRMDTQVKLRGYRIELGEIEARLLEHSLVRQTVVVLRENDQEEKQLVAYFVPVSGEAGSAKVKTKDASGLIRDLRAHLTPRLPNYMVPAAFVKLDALPLTPNGKLDRKRLPSPIADGHAAQSYEAPVGNVETILASIWEEVLKIQKIGRRDNFFALGGHSLLTLRLVNNLERKGINISALDIFKHATLESLAAKVEFEGRQTSRDRAISLRAGGSEPPLFFTHDGSAQLIYVPALAPYVDLDIPLYGLPAIPAYEPQLNTIEAMATRMAKMIRAVQPAGPYRIAGWSFGGLTAFEVAAQLVLTGEKVDFIGLIDTYYPTPNRNSANDCRKDFDDKKQLLNSLEVMIRHRPEFNEDQRIQVTGEIQSLAAAADFETLAENCRKIGLMPSRWIDLTPVQLRQTLARMHSHKVAGSQYSASRITVPMHIFHAEDDNTSPWLGWNTVFPTSQIRVVDVPGTHLTIMEKPNIASLGQALSNAIRSTTGDLGTVIENGNTALLPLQMG